MENVIAAADIGMFDPPGAVDPREIEPVRAPWTTGPSGTITHHIRSDSDSAFVRAKRDRAAQPQPQVPRSVHEQFLFDWEYLLGAIVDLLADQLADAGFIEFGPG